MRPRPKETKNLYSVPQHNQISPNPS